MNPYCFIEKQGKEYYHDYMEAFRLDGMIPYIKKRSR